MTYVRSALVICSGTHACAAGLDFLRKKAAMLRKLRTRRLEAGDDPNEISRHVAELQGMLSVLPLDVDATGNYDLHPPLYEEPTSWPIGTFLQAEPPGPETVKNILAGEEPGFAAINPQALSVFAEVQNASGGTRNLGWVDLATRLAKVEAAVTARLRELNQSPRITARRQEERPVVVLVTGLFGGFGSGTIDELTRVVLRSIGSGFDVDFVRILVVPGAGLSKDPQNTYSVAYGVLKEQAAQATRHHHHLGRRSGTAEFASRRTELVPTYLISDTNNARDPRLLNTSTLPGLTSSFLQVMLLTPIGQRIDARVADFADRYRALTTAGEPRWFRSVGLTQIHLDRERIAGFVSRKLEATVLARSLAPDDEEASRAASRAFLESRRIVEGAGFTQLADRLLERGDGRHGLFSPTRFSEILSQNLGRLHGFELLSGGEAVLQATVRQLGNLNDVLQRRADALTDQIGEEMFAESRRLAMNPDRGIGGARGFLELLVQILDNMSSEAAQFTPVLQGRLREVLDRKQHFEQVVVPAFARRPLMRTLKRRLVRANALNYARCLDHVQLAQMKVAAHLVAIQVLGRLRDACEQQLKRVSAAETVLGEMEGRAKSELAQLIAHSPLHECPVGLSLVEDQADLDAYWQKCLPQGTEHNVMRQVWAQTSASVDPLEVHENPTAFGEGLRKAIAASVGHSLQTLHVMDEFRHRFPDREGVLLERIRESHEFIPLRDSADRGDVAMVRIVGGDSAKVQDLSEELRQLSFDRGPIENVGTGDADSLWFVQVRPAIAVSDWANWDRAKGEYDTAHQNGSFEKHHVLPGDRFLPEPGRRLTETEAKVAVVRAFVLERLSVESNGLALTFLDGSEQPVPLGDELQLLRGEDGYRRAVDIQSAYSCLYVRKGPSLIEARLARIRAHAENGSGRGELERCVAQYLDETTDQLLAEELQWWRANTVPAAMPWGADRGQRSGRLVLAAVGR